MKVSDYIINFLADKGVTDIFGYPGGCINHLIDSASKSGRLTPHINYHEQGAALAACGYAQSTNKLGVAFSTSGPGATNLITGIGNAYFDSTPTLFITGQVDSYATRGEWNIRQRGFQETDVVPMMEHITKWSALVDKPENIRYFLEKACYIAFEGNPGPVVLDIPNDIQRAEIEVDNLKSFNVPVLEYDNINECIDTFNTTLAQAEKPVLLIGNGVKQNQLYKNLINIAEHLEIPVICSMPAADAFPYTHPLNFGFIGTNGNRYANIIAQKCDTIIALGSRMSLRQCGLAREKFAPQAKLVRIDIDKGQIDYPVHEDEIKFRIDLKKLIPAWEKRLPSRLNLENWLNICKELRSTLQGHDDQNYNKIIEAISKQAPRNAQATDDVGQNMLWVARSYHTYNTDQHLYMSAGHGAMGYSIPAAIGIYYGTHCPVMSFMGDGGFMMNVQELQFICREKLPIKVICLNNHALGMIRAWQARYLNRCTLTSEDSGYLAPNFQKIAEAFDMDYSLVRSADDVHCLDLNDGKPAIIEVQLQNDTDTFPRDNQNDQWPNLDRKLFNRLLNL